MDNDKNSRALTTASADAGAALARPGQEGSAVAALATEDNLLARIEQLAGAKARDRTLEFFTAHIRNPNTRAAYARAVVQFFSWMEERGLVEFSQLTPVHVAAWIESISRDGMSAPTIKQRLAAIRMLFDWLVSGGAVATNPASSVRGPRHSVRRGKTPVLDGAEAGKILAAIKIDTVAGLRDRALIGLMAYTFARISAALGMTVGDLFYERNRLWVRLNEKGGKRHEMPCHHTLEDYLTEYVERAGLKGKPNSPLFPSLSRERKLTDRPLGRIEALAMVKRRAEKAGIKTAVVNHTFRATGITAYLENGGKLERAKDMANHASTRTTQLYDRRRDRATLDDVELIRLE
jgi:site-specific recombinase XerD